MSTSSMLHSIGRGYRSLVRRPGFLLAAVLTLALCVGANSAMFSLIDAVLLRPLPYPASDRLAVLFETNATRKMGPQGVAPVRVEEWNRMSTSFTAIAGAENAELDRYVRPAARKAGLRRYVAALFFRARCAADSRA